VKRWWLVMLVVSQASAETRSFAERPDLPTDAVQSGTLFLTPDTRALQADDFANPGYLWVERGEELFAEGENSCSTCHAASSEGALAGAAARYPQFDAGEDTLVNLEGRINLCRQRYQQQPALAYESQDLLALAAYVTSLSRGLAKNVSIEGEAAAYFQMGRAYYFQRRGQLNLACNQCHDDNWGKQLRGDTISQGHPSAWPAYRLEWQTFGSLHRRIRDCDSGVRAKPFPAGSEIYRSLELYLAWRMRQLPLESPGIRR
jgi:sulfur-oxidizing protein SoxA